MQICGGGWNVMAIFKVIEEQYVCENEVGNLVNYILKKCRSFFTINLYDINNSLYSNQILYLQNYSGKRLHTRMKHFVLAFDSYGWEWEIGEEDIRYFMYSFIMNYFENYQVICAIHEGNGGWHAHVILNPVNLKTYELLHWSKAEYKVFLFQLAYELYMRMGVALQGVAYIDTKGEFRKSSNETDLYQNRWNKSMPLRNENGSIAIMPYMSGMYLK